MFAHNPVLINSRVASKAVTLVATPANSNGDYDGTGNPSTLFTVTGTVKVLIWGKCSVDVEGASATLEVGITGATALLIAQTTGTDIDVGEMWIDASVDAKAEALSPALVISSNIILTVGTANATGGVITFYCIWEPITDGATVVAA